MMEKSNGTFSNIIFLNNIDEKVCFFLSNGKLFLENVTFSGNDFSALTFASTSHIVLINVTVEENRGELMRVSDSWVKISSCRWQENGGGRYLAVLSRCSLEINSSVFGSNYFSILFSFGPSTAIANCNFTRNEGKLILHTPHAQNAELEISSCRFEENMHNEDSLIGIYGTITKFQDTFFLNNLVNRTEEGMISLGSSRASFDNCTGMNSYAGYSFGFLMLSSSSANISNCKFSGYRFGD